MSEFSCQILDFMLKMLSGNHFDMNQVFMKRAIELAKKGLGHVSPNPCVGALIVKGGKIVAEGWHKRAGEAHAEIVAINDLMRKSGILTMDIDPSLFENADLYVTLEPCCHYGRTPPCVKALIKANFKKVFIGMKDPFKKVNGKGIKALKQANIHAELCKPGTALSNEIMALNQPFIKWAIKGLPYVIIKAGISLDGKIATSNNESKWITSEKSRIDAKNERSLCDCVMIGAGTVLKDDSELGVSNKSKNKKLLRVVLDPSLSLPIEKKVFRDKNVIVFYTNKASKKNIERFKKSGISIKYFKDNKSVVKQGLKFLAKKGIQSVFVEGGGGVYGSIYDSFLKNKELLDKVIFYIAPKIIGGNNALSVVGGNGLEKLSKVKELQDIQIEKFGNDIKLSGVYNFY